MTEQAVRVRPVGRGRRAPQRRMHAGWQRPLSSSGLAALGGLVTAAAFEPVGQPVGAVLGPALLLMACRHRRRSSGLVLGLLFGLTFHGVLLWWLGVSIGVAAWIALTTVQALWFGMLGVLASDVPNLRWGPVWFAVAWGGVEAARSAFPFGGLPWGRLGVAVVDTPWSAMLPYLGIPAAGVVIALSAGLLAALASKIGRRRRAVALAGLVPLTLVPTLVPFQVARVGELTTSVVQGDVPGDGRHLMAHHRQVTENHLAATLQLADAAADGDVPAPDLVVWPENATAVDPSKDATARAALDQAARAVGVPLLVGAPVDGPGVDQWRNQGIVWGAGGPTREAYTKRHPVPFGEYIPFRDLLQGLSPRFAEVPRDAVAGRAMAPLDIAGAQVADAICFDIAYGDVLAPQILDGAQLVVVQTSNASFTGTAQLDQQFAITRARAIETGRAIAVASTNGVTALLAPNGDVVERAPVRSTEVLTATLPLVETVTPAVRWGRYAEPVLVVAALAGILLRLARRRSAQSITR